MKLVSLIALMISLSACAATEVKQDAQVSKTPQNIQVIGENNAKLAEITPDGKIVLEKGATYEQIAQA